MAETKVQPIVVNRPTETVSVITDMQALQKTIDAANRIGQAKNRVQDRDLSEAEQGAARRDLKKAVQDARTLRDGLKHVTLRITLKGLPVTRWMQVSLSNTHEQKGAEVRDLPAMVKEALPEMIVKTEWADGRPADMGGRKGIEQFADSLSDTQMADLIQAVQDVNSPVTSLPKQAQQLIG